MGEVGGRDVREEQTAEKRKGWLNGTGRSNAEVSQQQQVSGI